MDKSKVLSLLEKYKDTPVEVTDAANSTMFYANIDGRWLFDGGDYLIHVSKNTGNGKFAVADMDQRMRPFVIQYITYDDVISVRAFIDNKPGSIDSVLSGLTPIATSKSADEVLKAIESDSIFKASSTSGPLNAPETAPDGAYGRFTGSYISTSKDGIPKNVLDKLINSTATKEDTDTTKN